MNQINCVLGAIPPVAVGEIAFGRAELLDYDQALWLVAPKLEAISHHALQKARRNEIPYPPVFVEVHLCSDAQFERYAVESVLEPAMVANTVLRGKVYLSPTRAIGAVSALTYQHLPYAGFSSIQMAQDGVKLSLGDELAFSSKILTPADAS